MGRTVGYKLKMDYITLPQKLNIHFIFSHSNILLCFCMVGGNVSAIFTLVNGPYEASCTNMFVMRAGWSAA